MTLERPVTTSPINITDDDCGVLLVMRKRWALDGGHLSRTGGWHNRGRRGTETKGSTARKVR